ncbi:hypothetical protein HYY75_03915 [bacterium]|nr:hypothetical protein [bacterium]
MKSNSAFFKECRRMGQGLSLIELLVGFSLFMLLFCGALKIFSESHLPKEALIIDFAFFMPACEEILNDFIDQLLEGKTLPVSGIETDITEWVLENPTFYEKLKGRISNAAPNSGGQVQVPFRFVFSMRDEIPNIKFLKISAEWSNPITHSFSLQTVISPELK